MSKAKFLKATAKPIFYFYVGLYMFGFAVFPFKNPDALMPYEQAAAFLTGLYFLAKAGYSYVQLWFLLKSIK